MKYIFSFVLVTLGFSAISFANDPACKFKSETFKMDKGQSDFVRRIYPSKIALSANCNNAGKLSNLVARFQGKNYDDSWNGWTSYTKTYECKSNGYCEVTIVCQSNGDCLVDNGAPTAIQIVDYSHVQFAIFDPINYTRE